MPSCELVGHCVKDGDGLIGMIKQLLDVLKTSGRLILSDGINFASRMGGNSQIFGKTEKAGGSADILVNGLS